MRLQDVLDRNKNKITKTPYKIKPISIAIDDRPYDDNIPIKTDDKLMTKYRQSDDISDDKVATKTGEFNKNWRQTTPQTDDITDDKLMTKYRQSDDITSFSSLTGLQRHITIFVYNLCKISRDKKTKEVSITHLIESCASTAKSIKKTISRLVKKGILYKQSFKNGRGGWTIYQLSDNAYQEIMSIETSDKLVTNWRQTSDKVPPQLPPKLMTSYVSSNSCDLFINTTTTDAPTSVQFSPEWQNIDIEPLAQIKFTRTHLAQIVSQNKLTPQSVQESIYALAFDLNENKKLEKINGDALNYFMGVLRKGQVYLPPSNYESPYERHLRLYAERTAELEKKKQAVEKTAHDLAFREWYSQLTLEQKKAFLPKTWSAKSGADIEKSKIVEGAAREHFEKEVWPAKKLEIVGGNGNSGQELQKEDTNVENS